MKEYFLHYILFSPCFCRSLWLYQLSKKSWKLSSLLSPFFPSLLALKLLLVLLLAMPEALSGEAAVDLPVLSALLSLPFYLLCLLLASVHVLVCTSAESSCYFCSLSWGLVFAAVAFSSAMFCILVSMATRRLPLGPKIHGKVSLCTWIYHPSTDYNRCCMCPLPTVNCM